MANSNAAAGLQPVRYASGAPYNGACNIYYVPATDATALFRGDPVIVAGDADADGVPTCTRATAGGGNTVTGVVVGVKNSPSQTTQHRPASTAMYVYVADDPNLLFEIQEDAVGGALASTNVGQNIDLIAGSGNTTTGLSGFQADSSTAATTNTLQLRIEGFVRRADNAIGANAKILVRLNKDQEAPGLAGV